MLYPSLFKSKSAANVSVKSVASDRYRPTATRYNRKASYWLQWRPWTKLHRKCPDTYCDGGWKPTTLRSPILGGFIFVSLAIAVTLEVLSHVSLRPSNGGGLAFAPNPDDLPASVEFGYLYFPTILAVIYSLIWSWVDLDTKRLEPWFQMSKTAGATADDSLLLQYPFDFLPFIPVTAFRRKHWAVFLAGTIMILIFWVVTPLQSAIFNTGTVTRLVPTNMGTSASLISLESQSSRLNVNFLNSAYGISWLGQQLPKFTTSDFALVPFQPVITASINSPTESWSTTAEIYSTSLNCTPADVKIEPKGYTFSNGRGCSVSQMVLASTTFNTQYMVAYIGYHNNAVLDWSLQNPNCSLEHSNNFLAVWASRDSLIRSGIYQNLTALFCRPSYHIQEMYVKVNASDGMVATTDLMSPKEIGKNVSDSFNTTHFEYLLGVGMQPDQQRGDFPDTALLEQFPQLLDYNLTWPVSNMVGFGIAQNTTSVAGLADPDRLHDAFERAHKLLFGVAFSTLTLAQTSTDLQNMRSGMRQDTVGAIIMVRTISIIVEVVLAVIIFLAIILWYYSSRRPSHLIRDPASIADVMSVSRHDSVSELFRNDGTMTAPSLSQEISSMAFTIDVVKVQGIPSVQLKANKSSTIQPSTRGSTTSSTSMSSGGFVPVRPIELKFTVGSILMLAILSSMGAIVFLDIRSRENNGITLPSRNTVVLSILQNYLPTIFATLLEPAWVILNRILCLLQPFDELRKGNATSAKTIQAKYTSLPPQLVVWRALKSGHFLLAAVCLIAVSTNILAVSLSGLIVQGNAIEVVPMKSSQKLLAKFSGLPIRENRFNINYYSHFYTAMSNITGGTPLPAWIDQNRFYLPFDIGAVPVSTGSGNPLLLQDIRGPTTGFGAALKCFELSSDQADSNSVFFKVLPDIDSVDFSTSHLLENGTRVQCAGNQLHHGTNGTKVLIGELPNGSTAFEAFNPMIPVEGVDDGGFCETLLVAGWVRLGANESSFLVEDTQNSTNDGRKLSSIFLGCRPQLQVASFNVSVDPDGRILSARQTSNFSSDTAQYFLNSSSITANVTSLLSQANNLIAAANSNGFSWHNDSFTSDWFNSLLGQTIHSKVLVDPQAPVPRLANATAITETLYKQLFALLLGLNTEVFAQAKASDIVPLTLDVVVEESRLFISPVMFEIAIILLGIQLIVAGLYYTHRPRRFLPRMPTSIASIIAFVAASRAVADFDEKNADDENGDNHRYAYGRFIGTDGRTHVGIERHRYVVPLKSQNPSVKRRRWGREKDKGQSLTWI
ncbi:hypothetical protein BKA64DRAFT_649216 [Cadophora sp. MPI-SDFR-AT-0126]|nr:hypothetical protein BKA64DRAFT_649216 [Leotiomycetes sp. MPI-SDFR-AT-0126]